MKLNGNTIVYIDDEDRDISVEHLKKVVLQLTIAELTLFNEFLDYVIDIRKKFKEQLSKDSHEHFNDFIESKGIERERNSVFFNSRELLSSRDIIVFLLPQDERYC